VHLERSVEVNAFRIAGNPNGIPFQSPGLRGTSYPGSPSAKHPQPQRGCGLSVLALAHDISHNTSGVVSISERASKVGVARQPWAGGHNSFEIDWNAIRESQSDSVPKPRIARNELLWESVGTNPQPRWGSVHFRILTQGSSFLATLGWRPQSFGIVHPRTSFNFTMLGTRAGRYCDCGIVTVPPAATVPRVTGVVA
jgi:hypothetical protein